MKKIWEVIKKIFIWLGAVSSAIFVVLFMKDCDAGSACLPSFASQNSRKNKRNNTEDIDEINKKAAAKREEAIERISNADARSICESYGSVCDTINDGKERFRRRISTGSTTGGRADN